KGKETIPGQTCTPATCASLNYNCGNWTDGCSGTLSCGVFGNESCQTGHNCVGGSCVLQTGGNVIGNFRYVRTGATGTNNGSDWTNAYTTIPTTPLRNYTYYIASGNYGSYLFNTAESGTQIITIKKATVSDHGTNLGWNDNYGTGQAVFGNSRYLQGYWNFTGVTFSTGYWMFDGVIGSGSDKNNYGFRFKTDYDSYSGYPGETYLFIHAGQTYTFNNMTLRHFAIECSGYDNSMSRDNHSEVGLLAGSQANVINPVIQYFYINNCQVNMYTHGANWIVEYGFFGDHWSSSPNHGVQVQDSYSIGSTFRNNIFNICLAICIEGETDGKFYNNIFIPGPGLYPNVRLISGSGGQSVFNTSIYGNTIINHRGWILYQTSGPAGSGNTVQNNLFYNSSGIIDVSGGNTINAGYNSYFSCYNVNLSQPGVQNSSGNPFVNMGNGDFRLVSSTSPGIMLGAPYNIDYGGNIRGADGVWDRGAYEFTGTPGGNTIYALSCSYTDVSNAVISAPNGSIVQIPAGNCTWSSTLTINKQITLRGAGINSTQLNRNANDDSSFINIVLSSDVPVRITNIYFKYPLTNLNAHAVGIGGKSFGYTKIRIDHNKFEKGSRMIYSSGWVEAVVDHNEFLNCNIAIGINGDDNAAWNRPIAAGTSHAFFIEDNTFIINNNVDLEPQEMIYPQEGARIVTRYNKFDSTAYTGGSTFFQTSHGNQGYYTGTGDFRGQPLMEIYGNIIHIHYSYDYQLVSRGSSWIVYDNNIIFETGTPLGIKLTEEENWQSAFFNPLRTVWPAEDQIINSFFWNNTRNGALITDVGFNSVSDSTIFILQNRDYFMHKPQSTGGYEYYTGRQGASNATPTTSSGSNTMIFNASGANAYYPYTPYAYPHPLTLI
ncbi:MAG: hypothetical protein NTU63_02280, partial [Candidatus Pacearchaeota archaeon]|nr:hypothetical protein [Candidatus Pacearchaeota archaeon]